MVHPRNVLMESQAGAVSLPVCDHYCGVEARITKSLQLQAEMLEEFGTCVFDVTLDCEDGAPVGGEIDHANMVTASVFNAFDAPKKAAIFNDKSDNEKTKRRVAVRVHAVDHASFESDIDIVVGKAGGYLSHVMVPKVDTLADVERAMALIDGANTSTNQLPIHVLLESPKAIHNAYDIAAHPRVQSLSFGLMDFVSSHGGAIPASAMGLAGQFTHPLVVRAKLAIASACHAHGKVPSHCVVTEFNDTAAMRAAAQRAAHEFGYTRMWSIHPAQIRPILEAMAPDAAAIEVASEIVLAARAAQWAPISHKGQLHDRASYRFFWQVLERAHSTGCSLPAEVQLFFKD